MSITDISQICRIWKTFLIGVICLLTFVSKKTVYVTAEGNIGCLFVESLCIPHLEWCYDDFAFGKCLPQYGLEPEELFREALDKTEIKILHAMLEELQNAGLGWQDPYVQCRIQSALDALRAGIEIPNNLCTALAPPHVLHAMLSESPEGFIRFSPPREKFENDVYYPPLRKKNIPAQPYPDEETMQPNLPLTSHHRPPQQSHRPASHNNLEVLQEFLQPIRPVADPREEKLRELFEELTQARDEQQQQQQQRQRLPQLPRYEATDYADYQDDAAMYPREREASHFKERQELIENTNDEDSIKSFLNELTYPRTSFREVSQSYHIPQQHLFAPESNSDYPEIPVDNMPPQQLANEQHGIYTEGGVVYPEQDSFDSKEEARNILADMLGFTRHERLDVKKPGPVIAPKETNKTTATDSSLKTKKAPIDHKAPHVVDTDYAHVRLKNPVDSWEDGKLIVLRLAETLKMEKYFTKPRVDRHEVSFFVESNPLHKTALDVAKLINDDRTKNSMSRRFGIIIEGAGVGDKIKSNEVLPSAERMFKRVDESPDVKHVMGYMLVGALTAAVLVIVITLFMIKRNDKHKEKLSGLPTGITGAESCSKDYQELCRARMAGKGAPADSGRITALAKESERPPSSRSSTSSWNEEPALTNMDISTGHMVLNYMEDHLRNKGRLQREWEALCRYEAEPNARDAAMMTECNILNRNGASLPFDHSRVVLNHLANAEGMDYINASTITDHDPRAPAYVAAQGPLPTTIAHFWQMVWEQGAVVIVALCKLEENGENMCARYWPEEGSETYHIYEVHLVSEHIWCQDYLVRSFYLKNIKTAETRTVTQFHFLSWPQAGIPASAKALLDFRRKVNKSYRGRSCPIVVHSSNGAGRTGAYILLDLVLGRMNKGAREIDIAATLEHLRDQRSGLVETRQQFEFVLMAVAEEVHAILKALPQNTSEDKKDLDRESSKDETEVKTNNKDKSKNDKAEKADGNNKPTNNNNNKKETTKDETKK